MPTTTEAAAVTANQTSVSPASRAALVTCRRLAIETMIAVSTSGTTMTLSSWTKIPPTVLRVSASQAWSNWRATKPRTTPTARPMKTCAQKGRRGRRASAVRVGRGRDRRQGWWLDMTDSWKGGGVGGGGGQRRQRSLASSLRSTCSRRHRAGVVVRVHTVAPTVPAPGLFPDASQPLLGTTQPRSPARAAPTARGRCSTPCSAAPPATPRRSRGPDGAGPAARDGPDRHELVVGGVDEQHRVAAARRPGAPSRCGATSTDSCTPTSRLPQARPIIERESDPTPVRQAVQAGVVGEHVAPVDDRAVEHDPRHDVGHAASGRGTGARSRRPSTSRRGGPPRHRSGRRTRPPPRCRATPTARGCSGRPGPAGTSSSLR